MNDQEQRLAGLADEIRDCVKCPLHTSRTHAVPGDGAHAATVMLIGEAPGRDEDLRGHPFVGAAGRFLDQTLAANGLDRRELFITNIVKCRPPNNRNPRKGEIDTCTSHYLAEQIALVNPKVIMLLGRIAAQTLLGIKSLNEARGRLIERDDRTYVVGYHPAATFYRDDLAEKIKEDFALLTQALARG
jgi:uracil-DNA glycosylase